MQTFEEMVLRSAVRHVRREPDLLVSMPPIELRCLKRHGGDDDPTTATPPEAIAVPERLSAGGH
jgi:hypothetical protein